MHAMLAVRCTNRCAQELGDAGDSCNIVVTERSHSRSSRSWRNPYVELRRGGMTTGLFQGRTGVTYLDRSKKKKKKKKKKKCLRPCTGEQTDTGHWSNHAYGHAID